jgi:adenine deaminase
MKRFEKRPNVKDRVLNGQKGIFFLNDSRDSKTLIKVALGQEKADLAMVNARCANVYTGELLDDCAISIKGKRIAYVGRDPQITIGSATEVIDVKGKTVIPGLIDGHTHLALLSSAAEVLKYAIKGGTTAIVTETMEPFPVAGYEGLIDFLKSFEDQPIKILATAPAMISISRTAHGISEQKLQQLLARDDIVGMGESYWQAVLQDPDSILPLFEQTLRAGKTLEGHSAGASDKKLSAYIAGGVSTCHESINAEQALERLRLGLHVMIREGAVRKDLQEAAKIRKCGIDLRRLVLVSDSLLPADLIENGYMEGIVQKAIDYGFEPINAVQMATLNVAEHFSLDHLIGGIAPGRFADLVVIPDIATIEPRMVISNGRVIAENGNLLISPRKHRFTQKSLNSIKLPAEIKPADFIIPAPADMQKARVRVINMLTDLVTSEIVLTWPVADGQLSADANQDIIKISAIDRTHRPGSLFTGLIKGFGLKSGAIASSAAWDTSDIIVIGANDRDMAFAVNRIRSLQGGTVVCDQEKILAELPLPVFGLISDLPLPTIDRQLKEVTRAVHNLGVPFPQPILSLTTLTGAAIPYLRICEEGYVNLKDGKPTPFFVE